MALALTPEPLDSFYRSVVTNHPDGLAGMVAGNAALRSWGHRRQLRCPAAGAATLRYRLYDLDRILSRTLAYGLLTVLLAGCYAAVVLGLGQLLGRDSSLAVAAATLTLAALFQPSRRRVQAAVDRRFNRHRHDAGRVIEAFAARLRDQVGPGRPQQRAAGRGRPDHAAHPGIPMAATPSSGHRNRPDGGAPNPRQELNGIQAPGPLQRDVRPKNTRRPC